ncbi:MAG: lysophospholipid acyltransferase family protein [Burkholderiales bacterium]|nr:lysophospholipid acyltransferase family protein [Burkholderiales bacterium]
MSEPFSPRQSAAAASQAADVPKSLPVRLLRLAGRLPLRLLHALGAALGVAVFVMSPAYRRKLRANLRQAGFDQRGFAWRAAAETGRTIGELPFIWTRPSAELARLTLWENPQLFDEIEAAGGGILFLTPHLGAFELSARLYAATRAPMTVMFKPPNQPALRPLAELARNGDGLRAVPASLAGVRALLRGLRGGGAVGLLPDQVPGAGDGRWAPFFGRPAYTMTLPQRLAQQPGVHTVLVACERLPSARGWRLHAEPMPEAATPQAVNARMESLIRRCPAQYLWGYNRYKQPAGVPGPDDAGAAGAAARPPADR